MAKTIAIEGIDGSGKGTQARLLVEGLKRYGVSGSVVSFPRYKETVAGAMIGDYLNGAYVDLAPKMAAMLFAMDRFESEGFVRMEKDDHNVVVFDRYIGSNLAHQCARVSEHERQDLCNWILELEHLQFGTQEADVTILIEITTDAAIQHIASKRGRSYTDKAADLHESDRQHLATTQDVYTRVSASFGWHTVYGMSGGVQRSQEAIAEDILEIVMKSMGRTPFHGLVDENKVAAVLYDRTCGGGWESAHESDRSDFLIDARAAIAEIGRQLSDGCGIISE